MIYASQPRAPADHVLKYQGPDKPSKTWFLYVKTLVFPGFEGPW